MSGITREVSITGLFAQARAQVCTLNYFHFFIICYPLTRQYDLKGDVCTFVEIFFKSDYIFQLNMLKQL